MRHAAVLSSAGIIQLQERVTDDLPSVDLAKEDLSSAGLTKEEAVATAGR